VIAYGSFEETLCPERCFWQGCYPRMFVRVGFHLYRQQLGGCTKGRIAVCYYIGAVTTAVVGNKAKKGPSGTAFRYGIA
jgi:hypothetical protein